MRSVTLPQNVDLTPKVEREDDVDEKCAFPELFLVPLASGLERLSVVLALLRYGTLAATPSAMSGSSFQKGPLLTRLALCVMPALTQNTP